MINPGKMIRIFGAYTKIIFVLDVFPQSQGSGFESLPLFHFLVYYVEYVEMMWYKLTSFILQNNYFGGTL